MNSQEVFTELDISQFVQQIILGRWNSLFWSTLTEFLFTRTAAHPRPQHCPLGKNIKTKTTWYLWLTWQDIKPENIVCENLQEFNIKLVDFGLSRRLAEKTDICVMQGTPDFVSPEVRDEREGTDDTEFVTNQVINYEKISHLTDMWSVGVITYVLLSGNLLIVFIPNLTPFTSQGYHHSWGILTWKPSPPSPPATTPLTRTSLMSSGKYQPAICQSPH